MVVVYPRNLFRMPDVQSHTKLITEKRKMQNFRSNFIITVWRSAAKNGLGIGVIFRKSLSLPIFHSIEIWRRFAAQNVKRFDINVGRLLTFDDRNSSICNYQHCVCNGINYESFECCNYEQAGRFQCCHYLLQQLTAGKILATKIRGRKGFYTG